MIPYFIYESATGRALAVIAYDERGDGATSTRVLAAGAIDADTEYAPGGVKTSRPRLTSMAADKQSVIGDGADAVTVSQIPSGATAAIFSDASSLPRAARVVNDGTLVVTFDAAGSYRIVVSLFPYVQVTFLVSAT